MGAGIMSQSPITQNDVFIVTGGAKGITARCAMQMAKQFHCSFVLVGRSKFDPQSILWDKPLDEREKKSRVIDWLKTKDSNPTLKDVAHWVSHFDSNLEIQQTIETLRSYHSPVEYVCVDLTDPDSLAQTLPSVLKSMGAVAGIIHGAGILADKPIERKMLHDFQTVYQAKVNGLLNILHLVSIKDLRYLILFSSAAGFYGNAGQLDYACANEVLNKFAYGFQKNHPQVKVISFNWGPWDGGMVNATLKQHFSQQNIPLIPPEEGCRIFIQNVTNSQATQLLVGGGMPSIQQPVQPKLHSHTFKRTLYLRHNPFLYDHVIGGRPVLPVQCAVAWMTNACEHLYPGWMTTRVEKIQVLKGIVFETVEEIVCSVHLNEIQKNDEQIVFEVRITGNNELGNPIHYYQSHVEIRREFRPAPIFDEFQLHEDPALSEYDPYASKHLFHGPSFQGVKQVLNCSENHITIRYQSSIIDKKTQGQFPIQSFNPFAADIQFQCLVIWCWNIHQSASLPLQAEWGQQYRTILPGDSGYVTLQILKQNEYRVEANIYTHDENGTIDTEVKNASITISKQLNPLFVLSNTSKQPSR